MLPLAMATIFLRHHSGATHALSGRREAALRRSIREGSAREVNAWIAAGYTDFIGKDGYSAPLDAEALEQYYGATR